MKIINKKFLFTIAIILLVTLSSISVLATINTRYDILVNKNLNFKDNAKKAGISTPEKQAEIYPQNTNSKDKTKSVEEMKGYIKDKDLKDGAEYVKKELISYQDFINKYAEFDLDESISKDRMIWITQTHYKNGFQHKRGFVKNALLTKYYDAETGNFLGYSLTSLDKDGNGISMPTYDK